MKREGRQQEQSCTKALSRRKQGITGTERIQCNCSGETGRREGVRGPGEAAEVKPSMVVTLGIFMSS